MTDKEIIRAWVKRREEHLRNACKHSEATEMVGLLSYIDSMQEEPVSDKLGGINNTLIQDKCVQEYLVDKSLEAEIRRFYNKSTFNAYDYHCCEVIARYFAHWQKFQDLLPISKYVTKASDEYSEEIESCYVNDMFDRGDISRAFEAGVKWQRQREREAVKMAKKD